ncbi:MAG: hypothetical protein K2P95_00805 [Hyphomonadaceae bacterium]|nr:hypothetical protein [Hyphomonadaceae bacterium]
MNRSQLTSPRCVFVAWILAWATAIYVPSVLIAMLSLSPLATGENLFVDAFQVADEVSPAAKLTFAALLGGILIALRLGGARRRVLVDAGIGVFSMVLVLAFLPESWSRGFGVGLSGTRFELLPTAIYLGGGFLSSVVFRLSEAACARSGRQRRPEASG